MASEKVVEKHRVFQQYKEDVKERGKPFYPYAMLHDTIMSLVVVSVIAGLAIVWRYTTPGNHHSIDPGWLGRLYDAPADPGTINFVPRPDWYFYFLFYLLRIFKWPDTVVIGTVGLPTVLLIILIAVPFIDTRQERRLTRRPVAIVASILVVISMGVLTYKGATAKEPLASENLALVPSWAAKEGFTGNAQAVAGAKLFAVAGCMNCHTYNGAGGGYPGAPDLTAEGSKNKGIAFQIAHLMNPSSVNPGSPMPSFAGLGKARLTQIATFLEASKGPKK
ncbi:MAG: menaquinol-cytochrome c reductase cytochrome b/c subunit [Gaiellaceae bacterium]|jgi:mono/diheme cytochrome c family protein|nr:menaquinol-cytochrome c reductase cytochrome b/c subunit [Gaiellaceae bacterium]